MVALTLSVISLSNPFLNNVAGPSKLNIILGTFKFLLFWLNICFLPYLSVCDVNLVQFLVTVNVTNIWGFLAHNWLIITILTYCYFFCVLLKIYLDICTLSKNLTCHSCQSTPIHRSPGAIFFPQRSLWTQKGKKKFKTDINSKEHCM